MRPLLLALATSLCLGPLVAHANGTVSTTGTTSDGNTIVHLNLGGGKGTFLTMSAGIYDLKNKGRNRGDYALRFNSQKISVEDVTAWTSELCGEFGLKPAAASLAGGGAKRKKYNFSCR